MAITQFCKNCKHILTINEMKLHITDFLGLCIDCREKKKHAGSFKQRVEEIQNKRGV